MNSIVKVLFGAGLGAIAGWAAASPVSVSDSTTSIGPLTYFADTFTESGMAGSLNLDTAAPTPGVQVNEALLAVGDSGLTDASQTFTLSFDLTLDGVTHTMTQTMLWTVTPSQDQTLAAAASSGVLFVTGAGNWLVTLDSFQMTADFFGNYATPVTADFAAVPEPGTLALLSIGLLGASLVAARRRQRS
ncbi:MAG TPA: PEP-CTERM sorting domain-containing protein [Burkholderiaceae bacterium]|nr:PEP-CTERM sorting domain-containing protein [Burkholderiaceae bacterium]